MTNAERLARFPGPLRLYPPRLMYLVGVPIGLFFLGLSLTYEHKGAVLGGVLLSSFAILATIVSVMPQANSLTLRADSFEVRSSFRRMTMPWSQARDFLAVDPDGNAHIMFRNDSLSSPGMSEFDGRNAALAQTYNMPVEELAALLTQWRELAMARQSETIAKPAA